MASILAYKYKFMSFRISENDYSPGHNIGEELDTLVSSSLSQWGIQGYELHEVHYDGEILFVIMCLSWDPDEIDKKKKKKIPQKKLVQK